MSEDRSRLRRIFNEAIEILDPRERAKFIEAACGPDQALGRQIQELISADQESGRFLGGSGDTIVSSNRPGIPSAQWISNLRETMPRTFGDYELLEEIARGGMGVVFKAHQKSLDRIVAVKMMLSGWFASKEQAIRFRGEAEAAARLQHPNIVRIHETGEHNGQPYFSMDFVEGQSLAALVREKLFPTHRAAAYVKTIAEAIHYAHEQGVLHRDIKPSNVLIDHADQPRVTDFGVAKRMTEESLLTETGDVIGSPSFMPPEQASAKGVKAGPYSDVYSLGALLYHLLTGRPPFVGGTAAQTLRQVEHDQPLSPRHLNRSLPRDLETVCLKCLEKDPKRRYSTARELAEDLERHLQGKPVLARPIGAWSRGLRWTRRNPAAAGLIAALLLAVGVLCGLIKVLDDRRRDDLEAIASIRAMVIGKIEEMWQKPDKMSERITSEQLAALSGRRKSAAPVGTLRLSVGLGATENPVERAREYQPMLHFMEQRMEQLLRRSVRLDLVLSKEVRLDKSAAQDGLHLARLGALAFLRARAVNPHLTPIVQEGAPKEAVVFSLTRSGITNLQQVRSVAFADTNSTISFWAKVWLARGGVYGSNLHHYADLPSIVTDAYAHRQAVKAVLDGRFDAGVARATHLINEVGLEGRDWVSLLKFDSSQTLWALGGNLPDSDREALKTTLMEIPNQPHLILPDRVRNLTLFNAKTLSELEAAADRDLRSFERGGHVVTERILP